MAEGAGKRAAIPKLPGAASSNKEAWELFCDGTTFILKKWDLLDAALSEEWGGRRTKDKFEHMLSDLIMNCEEQWKENNDLHVDTLDVYLLECLESDFNIDFEDDTVVTTISTMLQDLYRKCAAGDLASARELLVSLEKHPSMQRMQKADDNDSDDSEHDESDTESAAGGAGVADTDKSRAPKRVVDEEGWETIVPTKRSRGDKPKEDRSEPEAIATAAIHGLSVTEAESAVAAPEPKKENEEE